MLQTRGAGRLLNRDNVYGSTETYGNCAVTDADDPLALRLHSQGLPLPGMTIRAVDPVARRPLPEGEIGELAVAGYVTPGYYRAPELDAEAFDRDGYFLTGDLGTIEADGRIRFRGRLKEMIKTGGVNVAPREVEQVLLQHPDIVQAYVVGVPDRSKGAGDIKDDVIRCSLSGLHDHSERDLIGNHWSGAERRCLAGELIKDQILVRRVHRAPCCVCLS